MNSRTRFRRSLTFCACRGRLRATEAANRADNIDILEFNLLSRDEKLFVTENLLISLGEYQSTRKIRFELDFRRSEVVEELGLDVKFDFTL